MCTKSLLLPSYIQIHEQNPARMGCWPGQDLCYVELDSMRMAVKTGFCLYLTLLQKRKYLVPGRYLGVTARDTGKERGTCVLWEGHASAGGSCSFPGLTPGHAAWVPSETRGGLPSTRLLGPLANRPHFKKDSLIVFSKIKWFFKQ